jgi:acetyl esterase/lipase
VKEIIMFALFNQRILKIGGLVVVMALLVTGCAAPAPAATAAQPVPAAMAAQPAAAQPASAPTAGPTQGVMPQGKAPAGGMTQVQATPAYKDVAYATASPTQTLDIYVPSGSGPFPLVIDVHGGGFMMGDKSNPALADQLLAAGYAVASINYRLSGEALAPAQIEDAKAAVRFLRANADKYNLDPNRFAAFGQSAGGNLVALLGTSCGVDAIEGASLGNAGVSSCVQAVVDWFGPIDFLQMDQQFAGSSCPVTHDAADSPESKLVGAPIQTVPDKVKVMNPITYIDGNEPAFLIQRGSADCNVPPQQSQLLYDALVAKNGPASATITLLEGAGHGGAQFETAENVKLVLDFLSKALAR